MLMGGNMVYVGTQQFGGDYNCMAVEDTCVAAAAAVVVVVEAAAAAAAGVVGEE